MGIIREANQQLSRTNRANPEHTEHLIQDDTFLKAVAITYKGTVHAVANGMSPGQRLGSMLNPRARSRSFPPALSTWPAKSRLLDSRSEAFIAPIVTRMFND